MNRTNTLVTDDEDNSSSAAEEQKLDVTVSSTGGSRSSFEGKLALEGTNNDNSEPLRVDNANRDTYYLDLDALPQFSKARRNKRSSAGSPPKCFGFDSTFVAQDTISIDENVPSSSEEAMRIPDASKYKNAFQLWFGSLQDLGS